MPTDSRREKIEALLADDPTDTFLRYSLAMELDKEGENERSLTALRELMADQPPLSKRLFALDFAWLPDREAGLYRLDKVGTGDGQTVNAIKITALDKPSAMAFAPDGTLYVTVFGTAKDGDAQKPGKLLKLHPGL